MGKRTSGKYARIPRDLYQTPPEAVAPLLPFLKPRTRFAEPCAGAGLLVDALTAAGHVCAWASDIDPLRGDIHENDVRNVGPGAADVFVTNPPWSRPLLHALIPHLSDQLPCWLIFDADWLFTKQAKPFKPRLRKVISVGRVKWIFPGSKTAGFDNAAWYGFTTPSARPTEFYGWGDAPPEVNRVGRVCFDCRIIIAPQHRWKLAERAGVPTCVHRCCENPTSDRSRGESMATPMPLFERLEHAA